MFRESQKIGPYTLIHRLGRGAFGEVWMAENRARFATTQVAVKLPLDEQVEHNLIEQEAQLWAQVSGHPNILPIIEANEYDGQIVIVSEYSRDGSLEQLLKKNDGKLSIEKAAAMTNGILSGLEFLHAKNIIHRDLKPDNILLQGETPRLADFGISRVIKSSMHATSFAGTPYYMSPEAFDRVRSPQTDIWSVGVMLYQMLSGKLPFSGDNWGEILFAITQKAVNPLPGEIPLALEKIVMKSLAKNPAERYQTAGEMRRELNDFWIAHSYSFSPQTTQASPPEKEHEILPTLKSPEVAATELGITAPLNPGNNNKAAETGNFQSELAIPALVSPRRKTNTLYFAVPLVILLLAALAGGGYWLNFKLRGSGQPADTNTSTTNTPLTAATTPTPIPADITLIPFRKGDKFGFCDSNKKIIIEPKYDDAGTFHEDMAWIKLNNKYGFIDKTGKEVVPPKYDLADSFSEGMARIAINFNNGHNEYYKLGFIDKTGNEIVKPSYQSAYSFSEGLACVELVPADYGYIDKTGKTIISNGYHMADSFQEGLAIVTSFTSSGTDERFIDKTGKVIFTLHDMLAFPLSEGLATVESKEKYGFIDKTGKQIIPFKYDKSSSFSENVAAVKLKDKWGFIDKTDKMIIPLKYDDAGSFAKGLAHVKLNNKYGFIDNTAKVMIPFKYDKADLFTDDLARVELNNKPFYIDKNGTEYYEP